MSTDNIEKFAQAVASSPELTAKIQQLPRESQEQLANEMSTLSVEAGVPVSAEEFLAAAADVPANLSDEQLEAVAGGRLVGPESAALSIFTLGLGCIGAMLVSARQTGKVEDCIV